MKKRTLRPARVEDVIPEGHIAVSSGGRWEGFFAGLHRHPPYGFEEVAFGEHVVSLVLGPKPFRVFHRKDGRSGERTYGRGDAMAVHLLREHSSLGHKARRRVARETKPGGLSHRALKRATDYVGANLSGEFSLDEVAGAAGYSPHHFSRLFRESTGLPPHQYVVRERVEKAKGLLAGTELPIGEVARLCGFSHQSHLTRHFKRLVGVTPAKFRR